MNPTVEELVMNLFSLCYEKYACSENFNEIMKRSLAANESHYSQLLEESQKAITESFEGKISALNNSMDAEKKDILAALEQVQNSINSLNQKADNSAKEEFNRLKETNQRVNDALSDKTARCKELEAELADARLRNQELQQQADAIRDKFAQKTSEYADFTDILNMQRSVCSLSEDDRTYIHQLCGGSDMLAIVSLGRDDGKIKQLWQYLRDAAIESQSDGRRVSGLNAYFEFCIKVYNSTREKNDRYTMLDIEPGNEFNLEQCIKTTDSSQIGLVREVLTKCITCRNSVLYKAIVRIG